MADKEKVKLGVEAAGFKWGEPVGSKPKPKPKAKKADA